MIRQRIRGIIRTTLTACVPWTLLGAVVGSVLQMTMGHRLGVTVLLGGHVLAGGLISVGVIAGAFVGIVNGLVFSGLVLAGERGKRIDQLSKWRLAAWGALATSAPLGIVFASSLVAVIGGVVGAAGAVGVLRIARKADAHSPELSNESSKLLANADTLENEHAIH